MQIQELLNTGRNNAVSARYLCGITGLDRRTLSAAIARERKHGAAICAATEEPAGFFIAANADELASYCRSLASREKEIAAVLKSHDVSEREKNELLRSFIHKIVFDRAESAVRIFFA